MNTTTEASSTRVDKGLGALEPAAVAEISKDLRQVLADVFALYVNTKGFHWHITGRHFRDYHLLLTSKQRKYSR